MKRLYRRIRLFLSIAWRKWDEMECDLGCKHIYRIDIPTAWEVAKTIYK